MEVVGLVSLADGPIRDPIVSSMVKSVLSTVLLQLPQWNAEQRGGFFHELVSSNIFLQWCDGAECREEQELSTLMNVLVSPGTEFHPQSLTLLAAALSPSSSNETMERLLRIPLFLRMLMFSRLGDFWETVIRSCCVDWQATAEFDSSTRAQPFRSSEIGLANLLEGLVGHVGDGSGQMTYSSWVNKLLSSSQFCDSALKLRSLLSQVPAGAPSHPVDDETERVAQLREELLDSAMLYLYRTATSSSPSNILLQSHCQLVMLALLYTEEDADEGQAKCIQNALMKPATNTKTSLFFVEDDEEPTLDALGSGSAGQGAVLPSTLFALASPFCLCALCFTVIEKVGSYSSQLKAGAEAEAAMGLSAQLGGLFHWLGVAAATQVNPSGSKVPSLHWSRSTDFTSKLVQMILVDIQQAQPPKTKFGIKVKTESHYKFIEEVVVVSKRPQLEEAPSGQSGANASTLATRVTTTKFQLRRPTEVPAAPEKLDGTLLDLFLSCYYAWLLQHPLATSFRTGALRFIDKLGIEHRPLEESDALTTGQFHWYAPLVRAVLRLSERSPIWLQPETQRWCEGLSHMDTTENPPGEG